MVSQKRKAKTACLQLYFGINFVENEANYQKRFLHIFYVNHHPPTCTINYKTPRVNIPVLLVPPEVVEVATKSSEPSEFWGGVGVGSGGGPFMGGKVGGCCISGPAG